jgi:YfiH family protein
MPFHQPDSIRYLTFESLDSIGFQHAVFTRRGGVSPEPWASLNVGGLRGDDPQRVYQNRVIAFQGLGRKPESVYDVWQVHSSDVISTSGYRPAHVPHRKADAILTDREGVSLFMRFGDCVPILLADPVRNVVGLVHAGWLGTVKAIISEAISAMALIYCTNPRDIFAAIGPSIAQHHYSVGAEVIEMAGNLFGADSNELFVEEGGDTKFDLWKANQLLLEKAGVNQIENPEICTTCNLEDWFSHRGEQGKTGRFGVLITVDNRKAIR